MPEVIYKILQYLFSGISSLCFFCSNVSVPANDDVSPGMLFLLVIGGLIIFAGLAIGIVLVGLVILLVTALISAGILSVSILTGLHKRSFTTGFKTFVILSSTVMGALGAGAVCWLLYMLHWKIDSTTIVVILCGGAISGILFGFIATFILQKTGSYLKSKFVTPNPIVKNLS